MPTSAVASRRRFPPKSSVVGELKEFLGDRVSTAPAILDQHGRDESYHAGHRPDVVVFCETTEEVSRTVALCARDHIPVIPFGTGTSLEGHVAALEGGVCIDLSRMDRVLAVNPEDLDCTVEAGVTRRRLNEHLRDTGLFFPVDPGADASLGGMAATRASGTNAVRYGTMRELVLDLKIVLADGRVIQTGTRSRKSSAGYDLTRLFVGSEGTLGIATEVTLRLFGHPESIVSAVCSFPTVDAAVRTVIATTHSGVPVARVELMDALSMECFNRWGKTSYAETPALFLEFHGTPASTAEQAETVSQLAQEFGGRDFAWSANQEERNQLWRARHDLLYALMARWPGRKSLTTDVCVPISRLAACISETNADIAANSSIPAPVAGHVGDGNFHIAFMVDPDSPEEIREAAVLHDRLVRRALDMGGTCTGEHGIGYGKMEYLEIERGEGVGVMQALKQSLDPHNIMNPGKIVPFPGQRSNLSQVA